MGTSGRTCTPTLYCQEAPPCIQVLLIVCRRRLPPLPPAPSRSRSSPHQRGSTPAGSEAPSSPHSPHSNRCGSLRLSMTNPVHPSSTGNASKCRHKMTLHHMTSQPRLQSEGCRQLKQDLLICFHVCQNSNAADIYLKTVECGVQVVWCLFTNC